jgi:sugar phosphate isomerase/epimerase
MRLPGGYHLTYCSNIHPGETWEEVQGNLAAYLPQVRRALGTPGPFGVGLRLSALAARQLEAPEALARFREFLAAGDHYVFTLNGFPYGVFHGAAVKESVYLPDWRDEERLDYTNRLARLLAALLPDEPGLEGSVSTVPGAFKGAARSPDDAGRMARLMLRHAAELVRLERRTGKTIALALEPEPCCQIETTAEAVAYFQEHLLAPAPLGEFAADAGLAPSQAEAAVRKHIGLCYDACHQAVEFEEPGASLAAIAAAGIKLCKFQISSALRLSFRRGDGRPLALLGPFVESTYLHQVVERSRGELTRFVDLPQALDEERRLAAVRPGEPLEWRVHFHVPIFLEEMRNFQTTQAHLAELLAALRRQPLCRHLEVETYTWDVLPPEYRTQPLPAAIARELAWARDRMAP